ncbi:MAG: PRC-barrel domain-containing protein [Actinomycetota bacterium]|nr:PRC-barrel domain-containing protein [Actinomycetota bacterium]
MPDAPAAAGTPQEETQPTLRLLSEVGETVDHLENDVRGLRVVDEDGEHVGRVSDLVVDDVEKAVHFLLVEHGGLGGIGATHTYVPIEAVSRVDDDEVHVSLRREVVLAAPAYAPDLVDDRIYHQSIYHHYGYSPFLGKDFRYAQAPYIR